MAKLWGGRFTKKTNPSVEEFTKSIQFDKELAEYDCIGSLLHIDILKSAKILTSKEHGKLKIGLEEILGSIKRGSFEIDDSFEDIHSYIQYLMEKKVGKIAFKLHTCRSRNDQIVFDTKAYCLDKIKVTLALIKNFIGELDKIANNNEKQWMPGYTHLQHAMPIRISDYFYAYIEMLNRDKKRLKSAYNNIDLSLGAGALAGTSIHFSKYNISDVKPTSNSIDTVSDRDFVIEILSALAIIGMHLSRLAEDLILWSTKEFDFIDIDEAFCTGSSLMPHKKNPDVLELIRGNAGRLYGNLVNVLVVMKGLTLSYNRDMQLDKEPLFSSFEILQKELKLLSELLPKVKFKKENIARQLEDECLYATDMADYLVQKGIAFKEAHTIIGKLIRYKFSSKKDIVNMTDKELKSLHPLLTQKKMREIINPEASIKSKKSVKRLKRV